MKVLHEVCASERIFYVVCMAAIYVDKDRNLRRWLNGKPCRFTSDITDRMVEITIGNDLEALYYFMEFCRKLNSKQEISDEFREYLAYLTARSVYGEVE